MYHMKNSKQRNAFLIKLVKAALAGKISKKYIIKYCKIKSMAAVRFIKEVFQAAIQEVRATSTKTAGAVAVCVVVAALGLNICVMNAEMKNLEAEKAQLNKTQSELQQNIADLKNSLETNQQESQAKDEIIKEQQNTIEEKETEKEELVKDFAEQIENIDLTQSAASRSDSEINSIKNGLAETELLIRDALGYTDSANELVEKLHAKADAFQDVLDRYPDYYPTTGTFSSPFGYRRDPIDGTTKFHYGVDISNSTGTPIWVSAKGVVTYAQYSSGYGYNIVVDHGNGFETRYAHLSEMLADVGDTVEKGELIAKMGATGRVTGPHIHFEVILNGTCVDPMDYIG